MKKLLRYIEKECTIAEIDEITNLLEEEDNNFLESVRQMRRNVATKTNEEVVLQELSENKYTFVWPHVAQCNKKMLVKHGIKASVHKLYITAKRGHTLDESGLCSARIR